jgi:nuclear protein localization family protein 4
MLFAVYERTAVDTAASSVQSAPGAAIPTPRIAVRQYPVDDALDKEDGLIPRQKDQTLCVVCLAKSPFNPQCSCRHGPMGMCDYCMPLEVCFVIDRCFDVFDMIAIRFDPCFVDSHSQFFLMMKCLSSTQPYNQKYLDSNKIKHMSFHAHVRKITAANRNAATENPPILIQEPSLKVAEQCDTGHAPYPRAMCAKCQPSAVILQQQVRHEVSWWFFGCFACQL